MPFAKGSRPERLTVILVLLTGVTGVVEAVSFLGLGRVFTAVMTGNVLFAGFGVFNDAIRPAGPVIALAAFAAGAIAGHWAHGVLVRWRGPRWLTFAIASEGVLILVAALLALLLGDRLQHDPHRFAVIVTLALAMGSRNATVLRVAAHDLPTTVVTRALAGLFMLSSLATAERRFATVAATFAGAALGALLLGVHPALPLLAAAAIEIVAGVVCPPAAR
ncbi:hypothetical protein GCM10010149_58510 [Nonomuraea roseoviolacea subsp. roseoviolacea]|uniref:Uncharacterized membrane protein YoaK (UPF0700 family) n=1 Tax=Nonomuraea roseoviolacea subsp. carminata TaxID=160689 RepID=A0ABT1K0X7_9ACTN|nr:DUF1275 family protein [Nonomuraea roseoviolacea]MCP2347654.1 uncharacterized membrane protein YoaK (UPF0700 family) [Nonomuraea roseoviolacea subsp. carminata]